MKKQKYLVNKQNKKLVKRLNLIMFNCAMIYTYVPLLLVGIQDDSTD